MKVPFRHIFTLSAANEKTFGAFFCFKMVPVIHISGIQFYQKNEKKNNDHPVGKKTLIAQYSNQAIYFSMD
jgi:hypothetical protein